MQNYLTWDKKRSRFVFQIRIPAAVAAYFNNRTLIRHSLGKFPEADAVIRAKQLADHYRTLFAQHMAPADNSNPVYKTPTETAHLLLDTEMNQRFVATWQRREALVFKDRLDALQNEPDEAWEVLTSELTDTLSSTQDQLRRHQVSTFRAAHAEIEGVFNVRLEGNEEALNKLAREFNDARVAFIKTCLLVLDGEVSVDTLSPSRTQQLPLLELWGDPASKLAPCWRGDSDDINAEPSDRRDVNRKTYDKYQRIATDLGTILRRRSLQSLDPTDICALKRLWAARGNGTNTIQDKLDILSTLLIPFIATERRKALLKPIHQTPTRRAKRIAFTAPELHQLIEAAFNSASLHPDDRWLLLLMLRTATHLEEACQLRAEHFSLTEDGWVVSIVDYRQTGFGDGRTKTLETVRQLPLQRGVVPTFDDWLTARLAAGGYLLFPDRSKNKNGERGGAASKRLNKLVHRLFPHDQRLVLQSTRQTAAKAMRHAGVDPRLRRRFLGHAATDIHDKHYEPDEQIDEIDLLVGAKALETCLREAFKSWTPTPVTSDTPSLPAYSNTAVRTLDVKINETKQRNDHLPLNVGQ